MLGGRRTIPLDMLMPSNPLATFRYLVMLAVPTR